MHDNVRPPQETKTDREGIAHSNEYLQSILERHDSFVADGKMDLIGRVFHGVPGKKVTVSYSSTPRSADAKEILHLGSYNYSGLNGHPQIIQASVNATISYGTTSSGVRLLNGTSALHLEMERRLASFLGKQEVVTFSSGFSANLAALSVLCRKGDVVLSDMLNHQSIVDGLRLSGSEVMPYRHGSLRSIESKLQLFDASARKFIVTDGVFSMDGDLAPLAEITSLAQRYGAFVIVDDAHGTGHVGPCGRGTSAHFGVTHLVDVITGSLSKGLPAIGGFVATSHETAKIIRAASNPYIYSASLPPPVLAAVIRAIDILESSPELIMQLWEKSNYFCQKLREAGFDLLNSQTGIVPLVTGDEQRCYAMARMLHEKGIYVNPVAYPAVGKSRARIRMNLSANLSYVELDHSIAALIEAGRALKLI